MSSSDNGGDPEHPSKALVCVGCGHEIHGASYHLRGGLCCVRHALADRATLRRSTRVAAVVGTALFAINQLDVVLSGRADALVTAKIAVTYAVPFCVATFGALAGARRSPSPRPR